jgi:hypothetical protein
MTQLNMPGIRIPSPSEVKTVPDIEQALRLICLGFAWTK